MIDTIINSDPADSTIILMREADIDQPTASLFAHTLARRLEYARRAQMPISHDLIAAIADTYFGTLHWYNAVPISDNDKRLKNWLNQQLNK